MADKKFPVKGFNEGLLIFLGEGNWADVVAQLLTQIDERVDFFKGARLAIEVNERQIRAAELGELRDRLSEREITLFAVLGKSVSTQAVAQSLGLATTQSVLRENQDGISRAVMDGEKAILIQKTLRSGMSIHYSGHIIVDGDVNPGAEVSASGSIFVWGRLRGSVHAGVEGAKDAVVCALDFNPLNLRIANIEKQEPKLKLKVKKNTCKAILEEDSIKLVEWNSSK